MHAFLPMAYDFKTLFADRFAVTFFLSITDLVLSTETSLTHSNRYKQPLRGCDPPKGTQKMQPIMQANGITHPSLVSNCQPSQARQ